MIVSVHQPNLFPWLGYFDKILKSDVFIFLDDAQFPKANALWVNRVYCMINNEKKWLTIPVNRKYNGVRQINEIYLDDQRNWWVKLEKQLFFSYKKHAFFEEVMPWVVSTLNTSETMMSAFNEQIILDLITRFNLSKVKVMKSSDLNVKGVSNERLVNLANTVGAGTYLCGDGATGYIEENFFKESGVQLVFQRYEHPIYEQKNTSEFVSGLSIIDVLMNMGFDGTKNLIHRS